jgi:O-antigen ligase
MQRILRRLFQVGLFLIPFAWTAATDELFEFNKMVLTYFLTVIIVTVWVWRMIQEKKIIFTKTPFFWPLLAFLISQILSTIFSIDPHTSMYGYYSRFHGGLLSTITYLALFFAAVSNFQKDDLKPLLKSLLWGSLGAVLYAVPEHFGLSPSCVLIRGDWSTNCWAENTNPLHRIFGTFGQPNWLAAYLLMTWPLTVWWLSLQWKKMQQKKEKWPTLLWPGITFLLSLFALLYTGSRSGYLGLMLVILIYSVGALLVWRRNSKTTKQVTFTGWFALPYWLFLLVGIISFIAGTPFSPSLAKRIQKASQTPSPQTETVQATPPPTGTVLENGGTDSGKIRAIVWKGALQVWRRYPLLGSGVETFAYSYYQDRPVEHNFVSEWDFLYNKAHNEFLNILATTGIVGLITYLGIMITFTGYCVRAVIKNTLSDTTQLFLTSLLSGYGGLALSNFLGFSTVMVGILFFLWPAFAFIASQPKTLPAKKSSSTRLFSTEAQWLQAATIGMIGFLLLLSVIGMWTNDRLFSLAKQNLSLGYGLDAYQQFSTLTKRAPHQAEYWEQQALALSQLAYSAQATQNATAAATLSEGAITSINQATKENPVHLNIWKSRAKVFLWLAAIDPQYYASAQAALETARQLAPTDPKLLYNLALIYESVDQPEKAQTAYEQAISLKPNYEQARKSFAEFLAQQKNYPAALEQYRYVDEVLKPGEHLFAAEIATLEASISAQPREKAQ